MAKVTLGNHLALVVPRTEADRFRRFYRGIPGCELVRETVERLVWQR